MIRWGVVSRRESMSVFFCKSLRKKSIKLEIGFLLKIGRKTDTDEILPSFFDF